MRCCSRTPRRKETVPLFASYQCWQHCYAAYHFRPWQLRQFQFMILPLQIWIYHILVWTSIIHVAERAFVTGAYTPFVIRFVIFCNSDRRAWKNSSRACWRNNWAGGGQTTLVQSIYWVVIISRGRGGNRIMETGSGAWVQSCSSFLG